jgi:hypothetical protein
MIIGPCGLASERQSRQPFTVGSDGFPDGRRIAALRRIASRPLKTIQESTKRIFAVHRFRITAGSNLLRQAVTGEPIKHPLKHTDDRSAEPNHPGDQPPPWRVALPVRLGNRTSGRHLGQPPLPLSCSLPCFFMTVLR